jgi:hypothetical protein
VIRLFTCNRISTWIQCSNLDLSSFYWTLAKHGGVRVANSATVSKGLGWVKHIAEIREDFFLARFVVAAKNTKMVCG